VIDYLRGQLGDPAVLTTIRVVVILLGAFILARVARVVVRRFENRISAEDLGIPARRRQRAQTLGGVLRAASTLIILIVAALMALDQVGVEVGPLIAAAGIGGLALGFGAQNLVRDVISGFFVLLENQYDVGDVINIAGVTGHVEQINLRTTVLRDLDGRRHVVPNGEIRVSSNLTRDFSRYFIDLPIPLGQDVDRAVDEARRTAEEMRSDRQFRPLIRGPLEVLGVERYTDSSTDVKVYIETVPGEQWKVGRELRRRIKRALDQAHISATPEQSPEQKAGGTPPETAS
jgi:small-conductance mechanosensitive channel